MIKRVYSETNKIIIGIIFGVLVLGGLIWITWPNGQNSNSAVLASSNESLTVEEINNYDFGSISMAKGIVKHQFKIKNISNEAVIIGKMYTSYMHTTASLMAEGKQFGSVGMPGHSVISSLNQTINSNEEATVEVVFDSDAHGPAGVGRIQRSVTLENNTGKSIELQFAAIVTL